MIREKIANIICTLIPYRHLRRRVRYMIIVPRNVRHLMAAGDFVRRKDILSEIKNRFILSEKYDKEKFVSHDEIFEEIFDNDGWHCAESKSGGGSTIAATPYARAYLARIFKQYNI